MFWRWGKTKKEPSRITILENQIKARSPIFRKINEGSKKISQEEVLRSLQAQVINLQLTLKDKNELVRRLASELSKVRPDLIKESDLIAAMSAPSSQTLDSHLARFGISAEQRLSREAPAPIERKTPAEAEFIRQALNRNVFLKELDDAQVLKLSGYMTRQTIKSGSSVITEGQYGTTLYVLERGRVDIYNTFDGKSSLVTTLDKGAVFGELAILYNCKRTATVVASTDVDVWCLDRKYFQIAVKSTGVMKRKEYLRLLKRVEKLKALPQAKLMKIADCLDETTFRRGEYIIRQGDTGDTFYIIEEGKVKVTQADQAKKENFVCNLQSGDYFGEGALLTEDKRSANVIVESAIVKVLTLDRPSFQSFVGSIGDLLRGTSTSSFYEVQAFEEFDDTQTTKGVVSRITPKEEAVIMQTQLRQLKELRVLGQGGFGCVKLVSIQGLGQHAFALKSIRKARIVKSGQEQHVLAEKTIMMAMKSPFIGRLYRTYKDELKVYFLLEAYLGGEVYRLLTRGGPLSEPRAQFCSACVVEALDYLHLDGIVYRDMKPENLMVDHYGYVKLVDFGFAKRLKPGFKTWTFCGTPEYFPPEIISNKGHDASADIWSFGILVYELLSKTTPFYANDDVRVYENILQGIDGVRFNKRVPKHAEQLIRGLCKTEPRDRLGYQKGGFSDVRKQRFYQGFDWKGLRSHRINSPIDIDVKSPTDTKYFENIREDPLNEFEDRKIISRGKADWDASF